MSGPWGDLSARARGLRARFHHRADLERLACACDFSRLAAELSSRVGSTVSDRSSPRALERDVRRRGAELLALLERWAGERREALSAIFDDEDRRSLRAIVRGALAGLPADLRLAGLVPTSTLPEGALRELAEETSLRQIAARLAAWKSPYGAALLTEASQTNPDPFELELAIDRTYFERAREGAKHADRELRDHLAMLIDVANVYSAILLRRSEDPRALEHAFLEGGAVLERERLRELARAASEPALFELLRRTFAGSPLRSAFESRSLDRLETRVLSALLEHQHARALLDPASTAPIILFALELRAATLDVLRIIWGVSLRAPGEAITRELVSAS